MKKLMITSLAIFALTCLAVGCGDDEDEGTACDKAAKLMADAYDKACAGDYADCMKCEATDETGDAAETEEATCEGDKETAAQEIVDNWDEDEYIKSTFGPVCGETGDGGDETTDTETETDTATE